MAKVMLKDKDKIRLIQIFAFFSVTIYKNLYIYFFLI